MFQGLLFMLGASIVPSFMMLLYPCMSHNRRGSKQTKNSKLCAGAVILLDILAFGGQLSMIVLWPIMAVSSNKYDTHLAWAIPLSAVCFSARWWENFWEKPIEQKNDDAEGQTACDDCNPRIRIQLILSPWKITLTLALMILMTGLQFNSWTDIFSLDTR